MEVIDLTLDSPPQKLPDADAESRERRRARKKPKRSKEEEEEYLEEKKRRRESSHRERDTKRSKRDRGHDDRAEEDNNIRRESSRERDSDRKRSGRRKDRDVDPIPDSELYFVDDKPAALPPAARFLETTAPQEPEGLILPPHVSVFGATPVKIQPLSEPDSDEEDYIEYLDYDNRKDFVRYYDDKIEVKRNKIVCKKCGAEDEHATSECTVLICSTCGARDEHSTRSCPIGKTCYTCGMKGHINADCPNRYASRSWSRDVGCERCYATVHQTSECPTLWRLYVYVDDAEQGRIVRARQDKKNLSLGQGGEGYIADDEWCYNCGTAGHWGDDCEDFYHPQALVEPSAFSHHVLSLGPFAITDNAPNHRIPREWEREVKLPGGLDHVGRQAKKKEMEKLARRQQQEDDDPGDWFQNSRNAKIRGAADRDRRTLGSIPTGPKKMTFGSSLKDSGVPFQFSAASSSKASLAERLSDPARDRHRDSKSSRSSKSNSRHDRSSDRHSRHRDDRERDKDRHRRDERGPRYTGGYSR
ncbi:hypothetical protein B0H10DRAFT_2048694 [Mycena sp. CBHHK59/15]|nr:hypothetical protein B0H10DRAFT_2048694 [Mycena sp. CBHHK59/15]